MLTLLQKREFRKEMAHTHFAQFVEEQQVSS